MIITPLQLWQGFDANKLAFGESIVHERVHGNFSEQYVYFNGIESTDGVIRVCCKLYRPLKKPNGAAVLVMDDLYNTIDTFNPADYIAKGFSVLVVDYAGKRSETMRYTLYPPSIGFCNFHLDNATLYNTENPYGSCWYMWGVVALRAVAFLEHLGFENRFMIGIGAASEHVYKVCYKDNALKAAVTIFSSGMLHSENLNYNASLDAASYALNLKAPIFIQAASNELNNSLEYISELYNTANAYSGTRLSIIEHSLRHIDYKRTSNPLIWFLLFLEEENYSALDENHLYECPPSVIIRESEKKLYCDVVVPNINSIESLQLFVASSGEKSSLLYWRATDMQKISDTEYLATLSSFGTDMPIYAFVTAKYKNGLYFSSNVARYSSEKTVTASTDKSKNQKPFKRLIYDTDKGTSNVFIPNSTKKEHELLIKEGPLELSGLTSTSNKVGSFVLADKEFKPTTNLELQFMMFSKEAQEITFSILCAKTLNYYFCQKPKAAGSGWEKLTVSPEDFKSDTGNLKDWNTALLLTIESQKEVLINSILWT